MQQKGPLDTYKYILKLQKEEKSDMKILVSFLLVKSSNKACRWQVF